MSLVEEREFWDMTPHRIKVTSHGKRDDEGNQSLEPGTARTYRCLVSDSESLARDGQGAILGVARQAWCLGTPLDHVEPVEINTEDSVEFISPADPSRPIAQIEKYYDETGALHNMVVHFK
ncbi:hypothetical protein GCM10010423_65220 [Streptomyces levis]|uniref:Uncharacterized protein n=1 Tax=Streptomyces levis TaxID=285566 RepID=A0ABN3P3P8_9ACTN